MKNNQPVTGFPFVPHVDQSKKPLIDNPAEFLKTVYGPGYHSALHSMLSSGFYKYMGYCYDFRPYLKNYLYKQYGSWHEVYAPNKTLLRTAIHGRIEKIIEVKQ